MRWPSAPLPRWCAAQAARTRRRRGACCFLCLLVLCLRSSGCARRHPAREGRVLAWMCPRAGRGRCSAPCRARPTAAHCGPQPLPRLQPQRRRVTRQPSPSWLQRCVPPMPACAQQRRRWRRQRLLQSLCAVCVHAAKAPPQRTHRRQPFTTAPRHARRLARLLRAMRPLIPFPLAPLLPLFLALRARWTTPSRLQQLPQRSTCARRRPMRCQLASSQPSLWRGRCVLPAPLPQPALPPRGARRWSHRCCCPPPRWRRGIRLGASRTPSGASTRCKRCCTCGCRWSRAQTQTAPMRCHRVPVPRLGRRHHCLRIALCCLSRWVQTG